MSLASIGNQIQTSITSSWGKVTFGYNSLVVPHVRVAFNALTPNTGIAGAHVALGAASLGLFYFGRSIWIKPEEKDAYGEPLIDTTNSRVMKLAMSIIALASMYIAAAVAGSLVAIGGGSTALAISVTGGIMLFGTVL